MFGKKLVITVHGRIPSVFSEFRVRHIVRLSAKSVRKSGSVGVAFVPPREMRRLNQLYHHKRGLTDVLSFSYLENVRGKIEGDIAICPSYVRAQARTHQVPYSEELARLLIHGVLHLAGYDHRTVREEKRMFALQERILKKI